MHTLINPRTARSTTAAVLVIVAVCVATCGLAAVLWLIERAVVAVTESVAARWQRLSGPAEDANAALQRSRQRQTRLGDRLFGTPSWERLVLPIITFGVAFAGTAGIATQVGVDSWRALLGIAIPIGAGVVVAEVCFDLGRALLARWRHRPVGRRPHRIVALVATAVGVASSIVATNAYVAEPSWTALVAVVAATALVQVAASQTVATWRPNSWGHLVAAILVVLWEANSFTELGPVACVGGGVLAVLPFATAQHLSSTHGTGPGPNSSQRAGI